MSIRANSAFHDSYRTMAEGVNAYLSLLRDSDLPLLYGPRLEPLKGRWREHFTAKMKAPPRDLVLEIGSHFGEVILKIAKNEPETALIGMDITMKRVVKLAQKAEAGELHNLTSVLCNARFIEDLFIDRELDGTLIFFPDPWKKKKRTLKHRLIGPEFLAVLARKLKPTGYFWFKTDWEPYYVDVLSYLEEAGWRPFTPTEGIPSQIYTSRFERTFRDQGLPTYGSAWLPPSANS